MHKKVAVYKHEKALTRTQTGPHLGLELVTSRTMRNKLLLFNPLVHGALSRWPQQSHTLIYLCVEKDQTTTNQTFFITLMGMGLE